MSSRLPQVTYTQDVTMAQSVFDSLFQILIEVQPKGKFWSQTSRTFCCFAPVAAVWFFCQSEASPHPSSPQEDVCCRSSLVCLSWAVLAGCIYGSRCCSRPGQSRVESSKSKQQVVVEPENHRNSYSCQFSRIPSTGSPEVEVPSSSASTDSLSSCVLSEPSQDPTVSHIEAILSRSEAVARTSETSNFGPGAIPQEVDRGSASTEKSKSLCAYSQQRTGSSQASVQVQADLESSIQDLSQGSDGLWTQLEESHAGVTLTKEDSQGGRDSTAVQADAESLVSVLGQYKTKSHSCQAHSKDSTQLLQELTWSHKHISSKVSSGCESVWPELLLQSNIEQFDKVQENFSSSEQQTATFKTHSQGLGKEQQEGPVGPLAQANGADSGLGSSQNALLIEDLPSRTSTPLGTKTHSPLSSRERSALKFSSTMRCSPKPGRKK